ncbi:MAG: hypothetical protein FWC23_08185 [Chitinispirillia bacterium]|nr:hypothetical protein [Chitinispirillia bacterium]MCL2269151.1 hypothetical protein [Chitinispirillia bacterium]
MKNNTGALLFLLLIMVLAIGVIAVDRQHMPAYKAKVLEIEKERIIVSNKLATAKIVQENLNHVRELIFSNMDFPNQPDTVDHETAFFDFITTCVNDLKLKLVSVRPVTPVTAGRITTYGYDVEVVGDFFRFGELCAKFENNRRLVAIESFDIDLLAERGAADLNTVNKSIQVRMRVNTFRISKS